MNKKKILIISILLFLLITIIYNYPNKLQKEENISKVNNSTLSFMLQNESGSDSYTLSSDKSWPSEGHIYNEEKSYCENRGELTYDTSTHKVSVLTDKSDKCYVYFDKYTLPLATYIKSLYTIQGENGLYLHDNTLENGAGDGSYRYSGANPDNYVCFGSDEVTCSNDNLYRIIGVFGNQVKIIKADYATKELLGEDGDYKANETSLSTYKGSQTTIAKYSWNYKNDTTINNGNGSNNWSTSLLNTVNLNTNYLNNIGNVWASKIAMTTWYLGGGNSFEVTAKEMYGYERGRTVSSGNPTTYESKVGLMYPSDYGYATTPDNWTTDFWKYSETNIVYNNWLYLGEYEWTISSYYSDSFLVFMLYFDGSLSNNFASYGCVLRPVLYLVASTVLTGGDGTKNSPYRIN